MREKLLSYPAKLLELLINTRLFKTIISSYFLSTLALVAIVVFWSFPSYDVVLRTNEMGNNWDAVFIQGAQPFVNHHTNHLYGPHSDNIAFRFVPAVILNFLHIYTVIPGLIFQFFTLVLFYYLLVLVFNSFFNDRAKSFIFILPICFVVAGHVYGSDYRGVFDTLSLDFLLMVLLARKKMYVIVPLLLAYFSDERALIVSPAIFLFNMIDNNSFDDFRSILKGALFSSSICLFVSWGVYFVIRYSLHNAFGLYTGTGAENLFFAQINKLFNTFYIGLEGFIIPFVLVVIALFRKRIYMFPTLLIMTFLLLLFISQSLVDRNRSMSYDILILILILILLDKLFPKEEAFRIVALVILINLVYDDFYPLLPQLYRMKFITHSI